MGFVLGWIVGFALGFGLIVGFARFQTTRSKRRCDLVYIHTLLFPIIIIIIINIYNNVRFWVQAEAIAGLARMSVQDSRKLLPDPYYPSWVVFSHRQKLSCILFLFIYLIIMNY